MKLLYKIYPDLREVDINKFIHFLFSYSLSSVEKLKYDF